MNVFPADQHPVFYPLTNHACFLSQWLPILYSCINIVLTFFLYSSGPTGILGSWGIQLKLVLGGVKSLHFPIVPMNRLNKTESAVFVGSLYF